MPSKRKLHARRSRHPMSKRTPRYASLTAPERATRERTLDLLSDLRAGKGSYRKLLRKHRLGSRTARKYLGPNLLRGANGRVRASKADRLVRHLFFPMPFGDLPVTTRNSRDASKLSEFFNEREKLLSNKLSARDFERKWRGVHIADQEVFADASEIFRMQNAGILKLENLYASAAPAR